jgi:hypothetical protein
LGNPTFCHSEIDERRYYELLVGTRARRRAVIRDTRVRGTPMVGSRSLDVTSPRIQHYVIQTLTVPPSDSVAVQALPLYTL